MIKINLTIKGATDKDNKSIYRNSKGEVVKSSHKDARLDYAQHDAGTLNSAMNIWQKCKNPGLDDMKDYLNLKDKLKIAWQKDLKIIDLNLEEAKMLKDCLKLLKKKESLVEYEIRTIYSIESQLKQK